MDFWNIMYVNPFLIIMNNSSKRMITALVSFSLMVGLFSTQGYQSLSAQPTVSYLDFPELVSNQTATSDPNVAMLDGQDGQDGQKGQDGKDGKDGKDGQDGLSVLIP